MKNKILSFFSTVVLGCVPFFSAHADVEYDTADPIYLEASGDFLSRSSIDIGDSVMRLQQIFSYGINGRMAFSADIKYQQDFNGTEDGFSNIGLGMVYRLSNEDNIMSDTMFGVSFGGNKNVRSPEFADTVYYAGMRIGRKWDIITLAGTIKTSWIFDEINGMAYIDLIPEMYVRLSSNWMSGLGFDIRKSTNPNFDQEWLNFKLVRRYGRTQYVGNVDYEFEHGEYVFGAKINVLF